jgi:hypothetical protein
MIYFKSLLAGLVAALVAIGVWILVNAMLSLSFARNNAGFGSVGFAINSGEVFLASLFGFLMGFFWRFRRFRRTLHQS